MKICELGSEAKFRDNEDLVSYVKDQEPFCLRSMSKSEGEAVLVEYEAVLVEYEAVLVEYEAVLVEYEAVLVEYEAVLVEYVICICAVCLEVISPYLRVRWTISNRMSHRLCLVVTSRALIQNIHAAFYSGLLTDNVNIKNW